MAKELSLVGSLGALAVNYSKENFIVYKLFTYLKVMRFCVFKEGIGGPERCFLAHLRLA